MMPCRRHWPRCLRADASPLLADPTTGGSGMAQCDACESRLSAAMAVGGIAGRGMAHTFSESRSRVGATRRTQRLMSMRSSWRCRPSAGWDAGDWLACFVVAWRLSTLLGFLVAGRFPAPGAPLPSRHFPRATHGVCLCVILCQCVCVCGVILWLSVSFSVILCVCVCQCFSV